MIDRRIRYRLVRTSRLSTAISLSALVLVATGCQSTQKHAREESLERWNQVRAQVQVKLASDQLSSGQVESAAGALTKAARLDPENPKLRMLQARVCLARGDDYGAQRLLEYSGGQGSRDGEDEYLLGVIRQQRLHWDDAYNHFVRAANTEPHEITYLVAVVENMLQLGEAREALSLMRSHENEFGWTPAYQAAIAECQEQLGDWRAAAAAWEKISDAEVDDSVCERLAIAFCRGERWPEAIPLLRSLLEGQAPESAPHLRMLLAKCLLETGQLIPAQDQLSGVLREQPENTPALRLLARVFAEQGHYARAGLTAERVLRLAPDDLQVAELVAALAWRTGDEPRALELARQIVRAEPNQQNPIAEHILAQARAGRDEESD